MGIRVTQRKLNQDGYRRVGPLTLFGERRGLTMEHVVVVSKAMGKWLRRTARVHHVDEDRQNNDNANLVACDSVGYHALLHLRSEALSNCGNPDYRKCYLCQRWDAPENLSKYRSTHKHRECAAKWARDHRARKGQ